MSAAARLAACAAVLLAAFALAAVAGGAIGPIRDGAPAEARDDATGRAPHEGADAENGAHMSSQDDRAAGAATADPVRGLAVSDDGLTLALATTEVERGEPTTLRFRVVDRAGRPVRDFEVEHERRVHLIVVRRDGRNFQHLHPELGDDGAWRVPLTLDEPGSYRVFADFSRGGRPRTLAADLAVVALREGDLAYLHVHPAGHDDEGGGHDEPVAFATEFPTAGRYRLYLQFKDAGQVHTAELTQEVR